MACQITTHWTDGRIEEARECVHALKGIFGDIGHVAGMVWCDQVRGEDMTLPVSVRQASLRREVNVAVRLLKAITGEP
ncbi:hypothetical protein [Dyella flagellata]|uniref:HPt domain-containing protein n=1 Tax=Dyella flagellata TaxID=1867833 RepID=A0ABQ5XH16_9GAMM|nr:hypothetical protein [Dyella flagellata]GLQ89749.1 hypothetical protein GCM10007898_33240 [Dyella flagellata]